MKNACGGFNRRGNYNTIAAANADKHYLHHDSEGDLMMSDEQPSQATNEQSNNQPQSPEEFIQQVTERVWQMLREDLRREQERRGKRFGS
jgi:hypothetical protein